MILSRIGPLLGVCGLVATAAAHPAPLDEYPERFPGKTLQQIRREWEPPPKDAWTEAALLSEAHAVAREWATLPASERARRAERLATENRRGEYRKRFANLAFDMADLTQAEPLEARDYLAFRLDHLAADDGFFAEAPAWRWDEPADVREVRTQKWQTERDEEARAFTTRALSASPALRPHWLVQAGATEFRHRRQAQAKGFFRTVVDACPDHPRAEIARLMLARVAFDELTRVAGSRVTEGDPRVQPLLREWWDACRAYRQKHPQGRFLGDLQGWEAGVMLHLGRPEAAMSLFLSQASDSAHPELRLRAFQQIEWMLPNVVDHLERLPWHEIAAEPLVALRIGYHLLDARSQADHGRVIQSAGEEDHRALESLVPTLGAVRLQAPPCWTQLDLALDQHAERYLGSFAPIREALHTWSLIARGRANLAAGLSSEVSGPGADDLALAQAFAHLAAHRAADGLAALEAFQRSHSTSPLNRALTIRKADAAVALGDFRSALGWLWDMAEGRDTSPPGKSIAEAPPLHLPGEVTNRLTAILSFAPLDILTQAADEEALSRPRLRTALLGALRQRHLSLGDFDACLRCAPHDAFGGWQDGFWPDDVGARAERWKQAIIELRTLTLAANDSLSWRALGDAWARHAPLLGGGGVTLPETYFYASVPAASHDLRMLAAYVSVPDAKAAELLDDWCGLSHARACFEKGGDLTRLHDSLRQRAESSPYWMDRAVETGDAALSRALVSRLGRPEIVPWTFRPADSMGPWKPGRSALWAVETTIASVLTGASERTGQERTALERLRAQLSALTTTGRQPTEVTAELRLLREAVTGNVIGLEATQLLNHIDDLSLLASQPDVGADILSRYAARRLQSMTIPENDPAWAGVRDFVVFWNSVASPAGAAATGSGWRRAQAEAQCDRMVQFLTEFPASPKREAALARLAVNTLRKSRCHCRLAFTQGGDVEFVVERGAPFDAAEVLAAVQAYEREFPQGRYLREIHMTRGLAAAEAHDWRESLRQLVPLLEDAGASSVHLDASNTVGSIFMLLMEPGERLAVKAAIESVPGAREKLAAFRRTHSCAWRLRLVSEWLDSWAVAPAVSH